MTVGVLLLLFAFYEAYWTNLKSAELQDEANQHLEQRWNERTNPRGKLHPELGEAFARMYIPSFGSDYHFAILEGTDEDDLLKGPGRYVDSQMPGENGNFAVAGHRVGKGAPFNDLGKLETCDAIVIETGGEWVTYRVLPIDGQQADCFTPEQQEKIYGGEYAGAPGRHITLPGDIGVIAPIPGVATEGGPEPTEALLTLTTCHPQFSNAERMIVHAMKVDSSPTRPAAMEEE